MKNTKLFKLLISCPGDVQEEIDLIREAIDNFNELYIDSAGIMIQPKFWKTSSFPQSGGHPQELLNKQFVEDCDGAVALFWTRFGTPTDRYKSGTEEEIELLLQSNKQVFLYFSDADISPSKINQEEYARVKEFQEKYKQRGIYWVYKTPDEFAKLFAQHLPKFMFQHMKAKVEANERCSKLILKGINDSNYLEDQACITTFTSASVESSKHREECIRELYQKINGYHLSKRTILPEALSNLQACLNPPVSFEDTKKELILKVANAWQIDTNDDFFELGNLSRTVVIPKAFGQTDSLNGSEEELEKYDSLNELHDMIIDYVNWQPFELAHKNLHCIRLALDNRGTMHDEDVDITLRIPKTGLLLHSKFPMLKYETMQYMTSEHLLSEIFGIPESQYFIEYADSCNPIPEYPTPSLSSQYPTLFSPDYAERYQDVLDHVFCYKVFEEGVFYIINLRIDSIKHNRAVAFPTPLFLKDDIESLSYTITSRYSPMPITGELPVLIKGTNISRST